MTEQTAHEVPHAELIAELKTNDGYVLNRHRLRAVAAAKALEEQSQLVARLTLERDSAKRERRAALVGAVSHEQMTVDQFRDAVESERASHPARGYDSEHDRAQGVSHLLRWAIDYASRGEAVKSGSLIMATLSLSEVEKRELDEARAAIDGVLELHKAVGFDIDDDGTLDPDHDCCDYCSERDGEAVIYPCETVRSMEVK